MPETFCSHWPHKHRIRPAKTPYERRWRAFLRWGGWLDAGYCEAYYPQWLRRTFYKVHNKAKEQPWLLPDHGAGTREGGQSK